MVTLPKLPKVSFPHRKRGYQPYKSENNVKPMSVDQFIGVDEYSESVDSIETEVVSRKQADDKNKSFRGFKVVESVEQYDVKTSATDTSYEKSTSRCQSRVLLIITFNCVDWLLFKST